MEITEDAFFIGFEFYYYLDPQFNIYASARIEIVADTFDISDLSSSLAEYISHHSSTPQSQPSLKTDIFQGDLYFVELGYYSDNFTSPKKLYKGSVVRLKCMNGCLKISKDTTNNKYPAIYKKNFTNIEVQNKNYNFYLRLIKYYGQSAVSLNFIKVLEKSGNNTLKVDLVCDGQPLAKYQTTFQVCKLNFFLFRLVDLLK
jgi:hypothetical protein